MRAIIARDLMTPGVLTVGEHLSISEAAAFLVENEITGAAVQDRHGRMVGVLSVVDIARQAAVSTAAGWGFDFDFFGRSLEYRLGREVISGFRLDDERLRVRDIMTTEVFTVPEEASVQEVAQAMIDGHLHRILVTREKRVVGIISTSDLLGLLVGE